MHQRYILKENNEQYFKHNDDYWHIPDGDTLRYLLDRGWVTQNMIEIAREQLINIKEMPLSTRAYDYVKSGHEVFKDLFGN